MRLAGVKACIRVKPFDRIASAPILRQPYKFRAGAAGMQLSYNPGETGLDPAEKTYRDQLADALEEILLEGAETLRALVAGLNARGIHPAGGTAWTDETLATELRRLAW